MKKQTMDQEDDVRELHGLCVCALIFPNALSLGTGAEPPRTDLSPVSRDESLRFPLCVPEMRIRFERR